MVEFVQSWPLCGCVWGGGSIFEIITLWWFFTFLVYKIQPLFALLKKYRYGKGIWLKWIRFQIQNETRVHLLPVFGETSFVRILLIAFTLCCKMFSGEIIKVYWIKHCVENSTKILYFFYWNKNPLQWSNFTQIKERISKFDLLKSLSASLELVAVMNYWFVGVIVVLFGFTFARVLFVAGNSSKLKENMEKNEREKQLEEKEHEVRQKDLEKKLKDRSGKNICIFVSCFACTQKMVKIFRRCAPA